MILKIVKLAFQKAKKETPNTSRTGLATHISQKIEVTDPQKIVSYKTLTRYYKKYIEGKEGVIEEPQPHIIEYLCHYLGYEGYEDFAKNHEVIEPVESPKVEPFPITNPFKPILIGVIVLASAGVLYFAINWQQKECMIWSEDHYEQIMCPENFDPSFVPVDKKLLKEFKKVEVDTNYAFFNKGKALVWYYKTEGKVEFFNMKGNHPIYGKMLRPVTEMIVRRHVFKE